MKEQELINQKISATPSNMMIGLLFLLIIAFIISFFSLWASHIQLKSEFESFSKMVMLKFDKIDRTIKGMDQRVGRMNFAPGGNIENTNKASQPMVKQVLKPQKNNQKNDTLPVAANAKGKDLTKERISGKVITHIVADGESLEGICKQYQVKIKDVLEFNSIEKADQLSIGELISIPLK